MRLRGFRGRVNGDAADPWGGINQLYLVGSHGIQGLGASATGIDLYGDKLIQLAPGDAIAKKVIDVATGKPLSALVGNDGAIKANGGKIQLTAAAARQVVDSVINNQCADQLELEQFADPQR